MIATIVKNEIAVQHNVRKEVDREFLTFSVENGWDDVKKFTKKVLEYDGRKFTFSGWNSDTNECFFARSLTTEPKIAKIL